jgi:hypothetical protein
MVQLRIGLKDVKSIDSLVLNLAGSLEFAMVAQMAE